MNSGYSTFYGHLVIIFLKEHNINISINSKHVNIYVVTDCFVSSKEKEKFGPKMRSVLAHYDKSKLHFFGYFRPRGIHRYFPTKKTVDKMESEFEYYSQFCHLCVGSDENKNLSGPQKS